MSDNESEKIRQRGNVRDHKLLPESIEKKMSKVERIIAHFEDGVYLDDAALKYLQKLEIVFHSVFNYKTKAQSVRVVINAMRCSSKEAYKMLDDVQEVYGNFFEVNKSAKRYIQEHRLNAIYERALTDKEDDRALEVIKELNKLYDLYNQQENLIGNSRRTLPVIKRSSDPRILQEMYKESESEEEDEE